MLTSSLEIKNPTGLHARPAGELCTLCKRFSSDISITCEGKSVNPRSVISILMGGISCGKTIEVRVEGEDEETAMESIVQLIHGLKA